MKFPDLLSIWPGQLEYMQAAQAAGAIVCVALGADSAMDAVKDWF